MTSRVITTGRAIRVGTVAEQAAAGAVDVGGSDTQSWLGVPITGASRVIGVLGLENLEANAYTESDERLLGTVASSMGVALENARLFDETKHLLAETEQRNAELAVINDIGVALADQLEFGAIVDAVGERLWAMFGSDDMVIGIYDPATNLISYPYERDSGKRVLQSEPIERGVGLTSIVLDTKRALRFGSRADQEANGAIRPFVRQAMTPTPPCPSRGSGSRSWPATRRSASSDWETSVRMPTRRATSGSSAPSPQAWAWLSRTPACSPRPPTGPRSWH